MTEKNRLERAVEKMNSFPNFLRPTLFSFVFGRVVRFTGTAGVRIELLSHDKSVLSIRNRKKVRNHLGSVHAAATALLAEATSGYVMGMNVKDRNVLVIKSMRINYLKRSTGNLKAVAKLNSDQIKTINANDKGEVNVKVVVTDEKGIEPVDCEMIWAWTPKRK